MFRVISVHLKLIQNKLQSNTRQVYFQLSCIHVSIKSTRFNISFPSVCNRDLQCIIKSKLTNYFRKYVCMNVFLSKQRQSGLRLYNSGALLCNSNHIASICDYLFAICWQIPILENYYILVTVLNKQVWSDYKVKWIEVSEFFYLYTRLRQGTYVYILVSHCA